MSLANRLERQRQEFQARGLASIHPHAANSQGGRAKPDKATNKNGCRTLSAKDTYTVRPQVLSKGNGVRKRPGRLVDPQGERFWIPLDDEEHITPVSSTSSLDTLSLGCGVDKQWSGSSEDKSTESTQVASPVGNSARGMGVTERCAGRRERLMKTEQDDPGGSGEEHVLFTYIRSDPVKGQQSSHVNCEATDDVKCRLRDDVSWSPDDVKRRANENCKRAGFAVHADSEAIEKYGFNGVELVDDKCQSNHLDQYQKNSLKLVVDVDRLLLGAKELLSKQVELLAKKDAYREREMERAKTVALLAEKEMTITELIKKAGVRNAKIEALNRKIKELQKCLVDHETEIKELTEQANLKDKELDKNVTNPETRTLSSGVFSSSDVVKQRCSEFELFLADCLRHLSSLVTAATAMWREDDSRLSTREEATAKIRTAYAVCVNVIEDVFRENIALQRQVGVPAEKPSTPGATPHSHENGSDLSRQCTEPSNETVVNDVKTIEDQELATTSKEQGCPEEVNRPPSEGMLELIGDRESKPPCQSTIDPSRTATHSARRGNLALRGQPLLVKPKNRLSEPKTKQRWR